VASPDLLRAAARVAIVDAATVEVVKTLREAGVRSVVLKGPGLTAWLYGEVGLRPYGDTDLLVAPWDRERVEVLLARLGYVRTLGDGEVPQPNRELHAETWRRERSGSSIDLHRTLNGARAPAERAWEALSRSTEPLRLGSTEVEIPSIPARALHVALHAAYHGALSGKPVEDLRRALDRADEDTWRTAAALARELDALDSFVAGLGLIPQGRTLADWLGLEATRSVEVELKAGADPPIALALEWLAQAPGARARAHLVRQLLLPSPAWVRLTFPFARRGRRALAAAYLVRLLRVPRYGVQAVVAWRRARRAVRGAG
jgi:Uncharacterised nucleotidyltransferase